MGDKKEEFTPEDKLVLDNKEELDMEKLEVKKDTEEDQDKNTLACQCSTRSIFP